MSATTPARTALLRALLPVLLAGLLVPWLLLEARAQARSDADAEARGDVASVVAEIGAAFRAKLASAALTPGTTIPAAAVATSQVSPTAAVEARDSGAATLDDTSRPPSVVVPVYRTASPPPTTAARRQALVGYRSVPLDLQAELGAAVVSGGGLVLHGPTRSVLSAPGPRPGGSRAFRAPLDVGGQPGWSLEAWERTGGVPGQTWLVCAGLLLACGALSTVLVLDRRHAAQSQERQAQLERDGMLVSGLAPVVQASLDLGEVIPSATSHLVQGLDLAGLTLSAPGASGERQLFAWGEQPDPSCTPTPTIPARLEAGETFALSLARGGRVLGVLRVLAGTALTETDLRALSTASELLGSTLANAEAFAQQQGVVERMQSVDELKTVFLATASHELRTPVAAIVGFSTLVLDQWGQGEPEKALPFLERVLANARSLEALTEQLLDFSRLERGMKPAIGELLDLAATTRHVLEGQPELTADHLLTLALARECWVRGSEPAVNRIITNLVGNAAKYSPKGTRITVTVGADDERVVLTVDDEGPGVAEADRERIFTRFYRGRGDAVTSTRGTGVGLAIVAEFAASMSGTAVVQQAPSGGARFRVSFPAADGLAQAHLEGDPHVRLA
jgi:signal transduction histidine kinase